MKFLQISRSFLGQGHKDVKGLVLLMIFTALSSAYYLVGGAEDFILFAGIFTFQFMVYGALAYRHKSMAIPIAALIAIAVLNRVILLNSTPILENDYLRYLWDGRVLAHGINPYLFPPNAPELDSLSVWYRSNIGWAEIRTIYPPVAELLFSVLHLIAPDSLLLLKLALILFETVAGVLLISWDRNSQSQVLTTLLYFYNPLLLKEVANSAHLDSLPMLLSLAAIYSFIRVSERRWISWVLLALSIGAKSYPILLLPLFLKLDPKRRQHTIIFLLTLFAMYLPFLGAGAKLLGGAGAFGTYWIFNAGIFKIITESVNFLLSTTFNVWASSEQGRFALLNDYPAKVIVAALLLGYIFSVTREIKSELELPRAALRIIGMLLLLSPVVNGWYVLWILPFACIERKLAWIGFTYLVVAAYSWFWSPELAPIFRIIEYGCLFVLLGWEHIRPRVQEADLR